MLKRFIDAKRVANNYIRIRSSMARPPKAVTQEPQDLVPLKMPEKTKFQFTVDKVYTVELHKPG